MTEHNHTVDKELVLKTRMMHSKRIYLWNTFNLYKGWSMITGPPVISTLKSLLLTTEYHQWSLQMVTTIFVNICLGLRDMHWERIVHGNLNWECIYVNHNIMTYIDDFSQAVHYPEDDPATMMEIFVKNME